MELTLSSYSGKTKQNKMTKSILGVILDSFLFLSSPFQIHQQALLYLPLMYVQNLTEFYHIVVTT